MKVPVIDFEEYDSGDPKKLAALTGEVDSALSKIGFMSLTNLGIAPELLRQIFIASRDFFHGPLSTKAAYAYRSACENFGYQGLCEEHLDPTKPADLKETFTMRNVIHHSLDDSRWPSLEFRDLMHDFYEACIAGAHKVQRVLAEALDVDRDFFVQHHHGENITLRLLHYPDTCTDEVAETQLGAGEHTDYGLLTLLFQDDVGGLEVRDSNNVWQAVDYVESAIIVNSGDLLERWTNGRYRSTCHRVKPKIGHRERFSIAVFVDPDSATPVSVLDSCITSDTPAMYDAVTAGEHLQEKILATHNAKPAN